MRENKRFENNYSTSFTKIEIMRQILL